MLPVLPVIVVPLTIGVPAIVNTIGPAPAATLLLMFGLPVIFNLSNPVPPEITPVLTMPPEILIISAALLVAPVSP